MEANLILDMVGLLLPAPAVTAVPGVSSAVALAVRRLGVRCHRRRRIVRGGALGKYKEDVSGGCDF